MEEITNETTEALPFQCPKCPRAFRNKMGLAMHNMRVHTRAGLQGAMWKRYGKSPWSKNAPRKERLAHKREYQRKLRARYHAEGRDSTGKLRPPGWKPRGGYKIGQSQAEKAENKRACQAAAKPALITPTEIWIMQSSGVIRCPHCQKVVGEIKQQQQETNQWHIA